MKIKPNNEDQKKDLNKVMTVSLSELCNNKNLDIYIYNSVC